MDIEYKLLVFEDINLYRQIMIECLKEYPGFFGTSYDDEVKAASLNLTPPYGKIAKKSSSTVRFKAKV